ncbi:hypothetical protein BVG19_g3467 [[Candida] boidinii]|nr:hypothetical protein BVG19_g3467 [[Candida] boidinii]OWB52039.1 hypothetical protein B5S27_g3610 [[Candida] boidinii]
MSIAAINHISPSDINLSQDTNTNTNSYNQQQNHMNNTNNTNHTSHTNQTSHTNHIKSKFNGFKYKGKPPITDVPELIELCNHFIETKNYHGLALISRQRGLPPSLRGKIWPVLLKYHPHALNPYITPDEEEDDEDDYDCDDVDVDVDVDHNGDNEQLQKEIKNSSKHRSNRKRSSLSTCSIPIKKIKFDLKRYLKYSKRPQSSDSDIINTDSNKDTSVPLPSSASVSSTSSSSSSSSSASSSSNYQPTTATPSEEIPIVEYTSELEELFETQEKIFKVLEYSITKFLKKWGTLINYHSGLTWIALGLAEWIPPLPNSNYVLCGRDDIAKNGTKLRNLYDDYFERLNVDEFNKSSNSNTNTATSSNNYNNTNNSTTSSSPPSTPKSTHSFENSNGHINNNNNNYHDIISPFKPMSFSEIYERAVLIILHTPDPSKDEEEQYQPYQQQQYSHQGQHRNSSVTSTTGNSYSKYQSGRYHTRRPSRNSVGSIKRTSSNISSNSLTSPAGQADGFENDETPTSDEDDETKNEFLPIMGGTIEENVSSFLYCLRKSLPELFQVLAEEDVLNVNSNKGDWIIYWLKYFGAKAFSRYDRGRLWDMLFGWRLRSSITNEEYNNLSLEIDNDMLTLLGQDIFWNPMLSNDSTMDFKKTDRRSSSIKTIAESTSSSNQSYHKLPSQDLSSPSSPSFQLDELNNDKNLPFSVIDSHFELIFLSLAFLKSKEFSLLELEQTEIKEFLNKMSSEKIDNFKNFLNNNQNKQQQQHNNNNNNKHHHSSSSNGTPHSIKIKAGLKATSSNNSSSSNLNEHDIDPFASATNSPSQESQSSFSTTPNINNNSSSDINNNTTNNNNNTQFQKSLLNRFNEMNIGPQQQQHHQRTGNNNSGHIHTNSVSTSNTNTNTTISSSLSYYKSTRNQKKSLSRDIENIIVEAGELWRKFYYNESIEENQ